MFHDPRLRTADWLFLFGGPSYLLVLYPSPQ